MRVTRLKQTCNHRWFPMWAIGVDPQFHSFSSAFISRDKALKMGWGSDHATLLHLAESKELSIKLFNARNEMTKPTRRTVTFGETWASPLTAVTSFVLPYICLPRCIRIGVVESIHVPTLGRQFSCGIQTITQGAPEITCITRWLTDQNIYNRSKGDIKWHKHNGNFTIFETTMSLCCKTMSFCIWPRLCRLHVAAPVPKYPELVCTSMPGSWGDLFLHGLRISCGSKGNTLTLSSMFRRFYTMSPMLHGIPSSTKDYSSHCVCGKL